MIDLLRTLEGVEWPTASTLLHFCDRSDHIRYLDYRALWSLGYSKPPALHDGVLASLTWTIHVG